MSENGDIPLQVSAREWVNRDAFLPRNCTLVQSAVLWLHVVRPFVRLWRWWIVIT